MKRILGFIYGIAAYAGFMAWMVYMIGFVGYFPVPKSVDSAPVGSVGRALLVNFLIIFVFAVQHTIMARPTFKRWVTGFIPKALERSTFVLISDIIMWFLIWKWEPIEGTVWNVENTLLANALVAISILGWLTVCLSSFMINHFELLGLQQVWHYLRKSEPKPVTFKLTGFYSIVRHPIMTGFILFFWATPHMTASHLVLASYFTLYVLVGVKFEERDLKGYHPGEYEEYMDRVPGLCPFAKLFCSKKNERAQ